MDKLVMTLNAGSEAKYRPCIPLLHLAYESCYESIINSISLMKLHMDTLISKVSRGLDSGLVSH